MTKLRKSFNQSEHGPSMLKFSVTAFAIATVCLMISASARAQQPNSNPLKAACNSTLPVLVMDTFPGANSADNDRMRIIDVDGDGVGDIFHGELVESLVKLSGHTTERLNMDGSLSLPEIYDLLGPLVESIETGKKTYSRINLSQEFPLKLSALKTDVFPDDPTFPDVTAANVKDLSPRILKKFAADRPDLRIEEIAHLFERLEKAKVPVVVAAGNFGPGFVNFFSMLKGVTSVGSLEVNGNKLLTSSDNSLVNTWKSGVVVPVEVVNGMDLNFDGIADFKMNALSGGKAIVASVVGRTIEEAVIPVSEEFLTWIERAARTGQLVPNAAVNGIDSGLYAVSQLVNLPTVTAGTARLFNSLANTPSNCKMDRRDTSSRPMQKEG
jgi:hypothetical protein